MVEEASCNILRFVVRDIMSSGVLVSSYKVNTILLFSECTVDSMYLNSPSLQLSDKIIFRISPFVCKTLGALGTARLTVLKYIHPINHINCLITDIDASCTREIRSSPFPKALDHYLLLCCCYKNLLIANLFISACCHRLCSCVNEIS